jgi:hypothetical protein
VVLCALLRRGAAHAMTAQVPVMGPHLCARWTSAHDWLRAITHPPERASASARRCAPDNCVVRRVSVMLAALAVGGLIGGCATSAPPPITTAQLAFARSFDLYTVYWAGKRLDGIPLTQSDGIGSYDAHYGVTLSYGNCEHKGVLALGGCTLPLRITTVLYVPHSNVSFGRYRYFRLHGVPALIADGGDEIELYTDDVAVDVLGSSPKITHDAAAALTPFNRPVTSTLPAFSPPEYQPGVSYAQLGKEASATGDTGTIGPPGELQPSVGATQ